MVNVKTAAASTRNLILEILRNSHGPVSGETIAQEAGISRVAVWKHVKTLNDSGYAVESSQHGYRLKKDLVDSVLPWEFGDRECKICYIEETDSTMNRAREEAFSGAEDGLVVLAEKQSAGRGTGKKSWISPEGGLFFTLITRPSLHSAFAHCEVIACQCALVETLRKLTGEEVFAGWPNDIRTRDGKISGILAETFSSGNTVVFQNLGIGVNTVGGSSHAGRSGLAAITSTRRAVLNGFLDAFASADAVREDLESRWAALCPDVGRDVSFDRDDGAPSGSGFFTGIDRAGWAVIREESGSECRYPPGSIHICHKGDTR